MTNYIKQVKMPDGTIALVKDEEARTGKADKATTLSGYGITDAYTKEEVDALIQQGGGGSVSNISQALLFNKTLVNGAMSGFLDNVASKEITLDENSFSGIKELKDMAFYRYNNSTTKNYYNDQNVNYTFTGPLSFPDLEIVKSVKNYKQDTYGGMQEAFVSSLITSASFPKLRTVEEKGLYSACTNTRVATVSFPALAAIGVNGMYRAFQNTPIVQGELTFTALTSIQDCGLQETFSGTDISINKVYFPALTTIVGDALDGTFYQSNVQEIHFRTDMQSTVEALPAYTQKFGATNATIYFDL